MKTISEHLKEAAENGDDLISVVVDYIKRKRRAEVNAMLLQHGLDVARDGLGVER